MESFQSFREQTAQKSEPKANEQEEVKQVLKVLDFNKQLKYFGEYLQVEFDGTQKVQVGRMTEIEARMAYLIKKYQQLEKGSKPKLCIFNYLLHQKVAFVNFLENDDFFQNIMRKDDPELIRMLIETLMDNGSFTLTSFMKFYNIFVWQNADKREQVEFVVKLLMKDSSERPIAEVSKAIDAICRKIRLENFNKSLENFNEVMKKLIFGDDYEYSNRKEYYLTRKALVESLQLNEECISIFINIFYSA
jgi:5-carboxymethyl-2-hydroxymuconate isomerase